MLKSELNQRLEQYFESHHTQVPGRVIAETTQILLDHLTQTFLTGGGLEIRGFGSMRLHLRPERTVRNPKTGKLTTASASFRVHFRPAKRLLLRLNASYR